MQNCHIRQLRHCMPMKKKTCGLDHGTAYSTGTINKRSLKKFFKKIESPYSFGNDEILCFRQDKTFNMWMGGKNSGLHIYNKKQNRFYNFQYDPSREGTIADNTINCIYIDRSGVVWLGTNKGVSIHNPSQQQFQQTFINPVRTIIRKASASMIFIKTKMKTCGSPLPRVFLSEKRANHRLTSRPVIYKGNKLNVSKFFHDDDGTFYLGH